MARRRREIGVTVNGVRYEETVEPRRLLVDFLREDLGLTGTHVGCEQGVCGACTVLVDGRGVRACLMLAVQADGTEVLTVEGLARNGKLHPLQEAFWEHHAVQCGFCTPGMLLVAHEFLLTNPSLDPETIRKAISGNLCRCTGYQNIVSAIQAAAGKLDHAAAAPGDRAARRA